MDLAFRLAYFLAWVDQLVAQPLMIPRTMIMNQVSIHRVTQRVLTKEDHSSKALGLDAQVEAFQMGILTRRQLHLIVTMRVKLLR